MTLTAEWSSFAMQFIIFVCAGIAAIVRVSFIVSGFKEEVKKEIADEIAKVRAETSAKVGRAYERLDEYKKLSDDTFVRRDMCGLLHQGTAEAIKSLKEQVEELGEKVDDLKDLIIKGKQ